MDSVATAAAGNRVKMVASSSLLVSQEYLESNLVLETKNLISELCRQLYNLGWVSGTGGSITIKVHDDSIPKPQQLILMSPFCMECAKGKNGSRGYVRDISEWVHSFFTCAQAISHKPPKCSDCAPLFLKAYEMRNAGAVIHSHGMESCIVTMINPLAKEFRITHMEMIKGIQGHGYYDELVVPIIENTAQERELTDSLAAAIKAYPETTAVLVRNHGIYIWEDSWISAKTQVQDDLVQGIVGAVPIPSDDARREEVIAALVSNVEAMIRVGRKITALKQLQGHIWRTGFQKSELEGVVFDDVPEALEKWHSLGIKVYVYSSSSRLAQRLLFGYSNYGDLRKYLCGYFDTTVGNKRETISYIEISESLGVHEPSEILFVTDIFQEGVAAKAAGLKVIISVRPGNGPLPENHVFKTVTSFSEI